MPDPIAPLDVTPDDEGSELLPLACPPPFLIDDILRVSGFDPAEWMCTPRQAIYWDATIGDKLIEQGPVLLWGVLAHVGANIFNAIYDGSSNSGILLFDINNNGTVVVNLFAWPIPFHAGLFVSKVATGMPATYLYSRIVPRRYPTEAP